MTDALPPDREALLARVRSLETLESAYDAWRELKLEHAQAVARFETERTRLTEQGSFLVGAVRAAGVGPEAAPGAGGLEALAKPSFLTDAEEKLAAARAALEDTAHAEEAQLGE